MSVPVKPLKVVLCLLPPQTQMWICVYTHIKVQKKLKYLTGTISAQCLNDGNDFKAFGCTRVPGALGFLRGVSGRSLCTGAAGLLQPLRPRRHLASLATGPLGWTVHVQATQLTAGHKQQRQWGVCGEQGLIHTSINPQGSVF